MCSAVLDTDTHAMDVQRRGRYPHRGNQGLYERALEAGAIDLRKEGGQGTPPPLDVNATCHVFIIIFKRKKLLVCLLESYYECFA